MQSFETSNFAGGWPFCSTMYLSECFCGVNISLHKHTQHDIHDTALFATLFLAAAFCSISVNKYGHHPMPLIVFVQAHGALHLNVFEIVC